MLEKTEIIAVILAGGAGQRVSGQDKGLLDWQGKPLISHVLRAVSPQVDEVWLSVNRNLPVYQQFAKTLITDQGNGHQGPMAGMVAAIEQKPPHQAMLISSCDSPNLPSNYVASLAKQLHAGQVAVVHDGQRRQNLHCLIERDAWPSLCEFYRQGGRAMHRWYTGVEVVDVDFSPQAEFFSNINTSEQLNEPR